MAALIAAAFAAKVAVASADLEPGTWVTDASIVWVDLPEELARDALDEPVGHLVVERVLQGEILRAERLLDPNKPERFTPLTTRALRLPIAGLTGAREERGAARVDLWFVGDAPCLLLEGTAVIGWGLDDDGREDSAWVVIPAAAVLPVTAQGAPVQLRPAGAPGPAERRSCWR